MNQNSAQAILLMFKSFPQTGQMAGALSIFETALGNVTDAAIQATVERYLAGTVEGHNRSFCPSVAEFAAEARRIQSKMPGTQKGIGTTYTPARNPAHEAWKEEMRAKGRELIRQGKVPPIIRKIFAHRVKESA